MTTDPLVQRRRTRAELSFHAALFGVLVVFATAPTLLRSARELPLAAIVGASGLALAIVALWVLAFVNRRDRSNEEQVRWTRRVFALAIIDTCVALALGISSAAGIDASPSPDREPARIGVALEEVANGVRVSDVIDGSPAERAGLRAADVVVAAEGREIRSARDLASVTAEGDPVTLDVVRGRERVAIEVTPTRDRLAPTIVRSTHRCDERTTSRTGPWWLSIASYAPFVVFVVVLWIIGRRRAPQWSFWLPFFGVLFVGALSMDLGAWIGCKIAGGFGMRAQTAGLLLSEIAMAVLAFVFFLRRRAAAPVLSDGRERWSIPRTYGGALLYAFAWMPRVGALAVVLLWLSQRLGLFEVSPMLEELLERPRDSWSAVLTVASAVVLAPIAEELLFRGLLLPHLTRSFSAWTSIYVGALLFGLLHVSHGVMFLGPLVLGAILGWARLRSRGLAAPIALHMTFNALATLGSWYAPEPS